MNMQTQSIETAAPIAVPSYNRIDRGLRGLKNIEAENTLLPESFDGHVQRAVRIYIAVRPLLTVLATLPLLPPSWRSGLTLFTKALDAVAAGVDGISANFKAGRDL
jgi:hypothetical protein